MVEMPLRKKLAKTRFYSKFMSIIRLRNSTFLKMKELSTIFLQTFSSVSSNGLSFARFFTKKN